MTERRLTIDMLSQLDNKLGEPFVPLPLPNMDLAEKSQDDQESLDSLFTTNTDFVLPRSRSVSTSLKHLHTPVSAHALTRNRLEVMYHSPSNPFCPSYSYSPHSFQRMGASPRSCTRQRTSSVVQKEAVTATATTTPLGHGQATPRPGAGALAIARLLSIPTSPSTSTPSSSPARTLLLSPHRSPGHLEGGRGRGHGRGRNFSDRPGGVDWLSRKWLDTHPMARKLRLHSIQDLLRSLVLRLDKLGLGVTPYGLVVKLLFWAAMILFAAICGLGRQGSALHGGQAHDLDPSGLGAGPAGLSYGAWWSE